MPTSRTKKSPPKRGAGSQAKGRTGTKSRAKAKRGSTTTRSAKTGGARKPAASKKKPGRSGAGKPAKPPAKKAAKGAAKKPARPKKATARTAKASPKRGKRTAPAKKKGAAAKASKRPKVRSARGKPASGPIVGGAAAERPVKPSARAGGKRRAEKGVVGHRRTHEQTGSRSRKARKGGALTTSVDPPPAPGEKRSFGLRGAAPWVARHAAKHAEELRRRNAEPPPPGSARATLRVPPEAEQIKATVAQLHQITSKIRSMCRKLDKHFYEVGELLADIQLRELHVAKGYSNFESFLDRETDLGRANALRLIRIAHTFLRETAYDYGIDRLASALAALDGDIQAGSPSQPSSSSFSSPALPAKAPIRFNE